MNPLYIGKVAITVSMTRRVFFGVFLSTAVLLAPLAHDAAAATDNKTTSKSTAKASSKTASKPSSSKASSSKKASKPATKTTKTAAKKKTAPVDRSAALVVDASTGKVLYQSNAGNLRYPASLTKMMTLYLTFDALKKGRLSMDDTLAVSQKAAAQPQTNISLKAGERLPLHTAIESLVVRSANDVALVLAETLGKTEWNFALMMTQKARELGMKNTVYRNASGLPDEGQVTTAYDQARLGIALRRDFPEYYHYFSLQSFEHKGVVYSSHNRVLSRFNGADGLKTGYIRASGFNLVTSAKRNDINLVAVVLGGSTAQARDDQMISLLNRTFAEMEGKKRTMVNQGRDASTQEIDNISLLDVPVPHAQNAEEPALLLAGGPIHRSM